MYPMAIHSWKLGNRAFLGILLLIGMLSGNALNAQTSRKALEAKRKRVEREIAQSQRILLNTQNKKQATLHQLTTLSRIIDQRQELIVNLEKEVIATEEEIVRQYEQLSLLQADLLKEQSKLNETVRKAYKTRKSGQEMAFIFSSNSVKQAVRRWKYLRKVSDYRRFQIAQLYDQQVKVENALNALNQVRKEKTQLLIAQEQERKKLESDKQTKTELVSVLSKKEDTLNERIAQKQKQMAQLNAAIKTAIAREIEAERKRREREAARRKKTGTAPTNKTPVASELSHSFKTSRGRLPWPVSQGFVSQTFGVHRHPEFKNITLQNNGIDITTQSGQNVTAVFKGTVSAILSIPGEGEAILVNHGDYFSVYSRMTGINVSKGQKLNNGDVLGKVMTDDDGKAVLQFQIWSGQEKQNPENWLKGR